MKKILNEDYTAGVLAGVPIFCVIRLYKTEYPAASHIKKQYIFKFSNNYGASIVEFEDRKFSGGQQYELAVVKYIDGSEKGSINYDTDVSSDVERGDAMYMHELLDRIEALK
jgi:hypothetical protein